MRRLREHPIHRCAVPLPQWGRQRGGGFATKKKANPASLCSAAPSKGRGSRGHSLLPMEGGAPKGRRLDGESGMKDKWGNASQVDNLREHPIHRYAIPLPQWGRLRYESTAIPETKLSPRGEDAPKGRIGQKRYEKRAGKIVSSMPFTAAPYPLLPRSPFPIGEGGPRQRRSGAFVYCLLEMISPALFHTAPALSGSLRSLPSPRGEGFGSGKYCMHTLFACETAIPSYRHLPKV